MTEQRPPQVFISYSHDTVEHQERVLSLANQLRADGINAEIDQYNPEPSEGWPLWCERQIAAADVVLMLCTETYYRRVSGNEEQGKGLGVVWEARIIRQLIYDAGAISNKFVPVLFSDASPEQVPMPVKSWTRYVVDTKDGYENLYRRLTGQPKARKPGLGTLRKRPERARQWREKPLDMGQVLAELHNVPELPPHFLPRPALDELKKKLLAANGGAVAVTGMSGIGKSVLASALVHEEAVRSAFPDGIFWITLGQTPDVLTRQADLYWLLTHEKGGFADAQQGRIALQEALRGRRCIVVLDDVWRLVDTESFNVVDTEARLLLTTRDAAIVRAIGAREHELDRLDRAASLRLLAQTALVSESSVPAEADAIAEECGDLPLALALAAGMIGGQADMWHLVLEALRQADIEQIYGEFPGYPYPHIFGAIEASVKALGSDRDRYLDLVIFPENVPIPEAALKTLWADIKPLQVRALVTRFRDRSLARLDADNRLTLHDLQRDFIHKRANDTRVRHEQLVEAYRSHCPNGWASGPNDGYFFPFLPHHLAAAGRRDELKTLLSDYRWMAAKLSSTNPTALIADYDRLPDDQDAELIQGALQLSAHILTKNPGQLAGQLTGRLRGNERPALSVLIDDIERLAPQPWLCPQMPSLIPPGGPLICTLTAHQNSILSLSMLSSEIMGVSCSSKAHHWIASISKDGTFKLWDNEDSYSLPFSLGDNDNPALCFTPCGDGIHVIVGFQAGNIIMFDMNKKCARYDKQAHQAAVIAINTLYSQDAFFTISRDGDLATWEVNSGRNLRRIALPHVDIGDVIRATGDPIGKRILLIHQPHSGPPALSIIDMDSAVLSPFSVSHYKTNSVTVTPDLQYVVSGGASGRFQYTQAPLRVWDLRGAVLKIAGQGPFRDDLPRYYGNSVHNLWDGYGLIVLVSSTPDSKRVISCHAPMMSDHDTHIRVWDIESGRLLGTFQGHSTSILEIQIADDLAVTHALEDNRVLLWDLTLPREDIPETVRLAGPVRRFEPNKFKRAPKAVFGGLSGHYEQIVKLAIAESGGLVVSGDKAGVIKCWDVTKARLVDEYRYHTAPVCHMSAGSDSTSVVSCASDGSIKHWDFENNDYRTVREKSLFYDTSDYPCMAWVTTDRQLMFLTKNGSVCQCGLISDTELFHIRSPFSVVQLVGSGQYAVVGYENGEIEIYNVQECTLYKTYKMHTDAVVDVAVSDDMSLAAAVSHNGSLAIWDLKDGHHRDCFESLVTKPVSVFFLRNNVILVSCESSWGMLELESRKLDITYYSETSKTVASVVSRNRHQLCCAQQGEMVRVWDIETKRITGELRTDAPLTSVCSAAGNRFWLGSKNGAVHIVSVRSTSDSVCNTAPGHGAFS